MQRKKTLRYPGHPTLAAWGLIGLSLAILLPGRALSASTEHANPLVDPHACRFWGCVSASTPSSVIEDHLVNLPNSIKKLSPTNANGWSVAYFPARPPAPMPEARPPGTRSVLRLPVASPTVFRGQPAACLDPLYDAAVAEAARAEPRIAVSHVRLCSSGLCDIPNPHPFERKKNRRNWLLCHNGTIDRNVLLALIRPEYLAANPPQYGDDPTEWIDSDLYFIYVLQTLEAFDWAVKPALGEVVQCLRDSIPGTGEQLNFILTDGMTLWAYREGNTLYFLHDETRTFYSAVASQYPSEQQGDWVEMADGQLVTIRQGAAPVLENIEEYFGVLSSPAPLE